MRLTFSGKVSVFSSLQARSQQHLRQRRLVARCSASIAAWSDFAAISALGAEEPEHVAMAEAAEFLRL